MSDNLEFQMYMYLKALVENAGFAGRFPDSPDGQNPAIYRVGRNNHPQGYGFGAHCGRYELTHSGQWLVDGEISDRPSTPSKIIFSKQMNDEAFN